MAVRRAWCGAAGVRVYAYACERVESLTKAWQHTTDTRRIRRVVERREGIALPSARRDGRLVPRSGRAYVDRSSLWLVRTRSARHTGVSVSVHMRTGAALRGVRACVSVRCVK